LFYAVPAGFSGSFCGNLCRAVVNLGPANVEFRPTSLFSQRYTGRLDFSYQGAPVYHAGRLQNESALPLNQFPHDCFSSTTPAADIATTYHCAETYLLSCSRHSAFAV
jgi:hypothetical protein